MGTHEKRMTKKASKIKVKNISGKMKMEEVRRGTIDSSPENSKAKRRSLDIGQKLKDFLKECKKKKKKKQKKKQGTQKKNKRKRKNKKAR